MQTTKPTYEELVAENKRLRAGAALSAQIGTTAQSRPTNVCVASPSTLADTLEVRMYSSGHALRQSTVLSHRDIILLPKHISHAIVRHGSVWTAWIHCAVHLPTFQDEHTQFCEHEGGYNLDNENPSWLSIYFAFVAVGQLPSSEFAVQLISTWTDQSDVYEA